MIIKVADKKANFEHVTVSVTVSQWMDSVCYAAHCVLCHHCLICPFETFTCCFLFCAMMSLNKPIEGEIFKHKTYLFKFFLHKKLSVKEKLGSECL